jgi:diguanylate cyclase (GGDEF)-like protein
MGRGHDDEAWLGRESLFRKKLNQLRTTGHITSLPKSDSLSRIKELEQSSLLSNVQTFFQQSSAPELERLALLDNLTELYNHASITRILNDEIRRSQRYKYASTIICLSPDGIKNITASNGQLAADGIYKGTANFLMKTIRDVDIPGRYSLETFLIICPNTNLEGASVLAERIRSNICQSHISEMGQNWTVTASIAIAEFPSMSDNAENLVAISEKALQQTKNAGGNKVAIAKSSKS